MSLSAQGIGFRYSRSEWLFRDVSLTVHPGEIVGLCGPSGVGKTTLARILSGYLMPQEGSVTLHGAPLPVGGYHPVQLVMQHPEQSVNPRWRLRQIVNEGWTVDAELLTSLGIQPEWLDRRPVELSSGELQRCCVARALGPGTQMLIADEMTAMVDAITQAQLWHVIMQQAEKRKLGVLAISHDPALLERICHRVIELKKHKK